MSLSRSLKLDWHDATCRRLDYAPIDDHWATCLSCGSSGLMPYSPPTLTTESSFRLLRLLPGWTEDPIRCEIHVNDLKDKPIFNAISYTWADEKGDDQKLAEIFIDGKVISVTKNCHAALRRVQQTDIVAYTWIDAICIDQENDIERGHQVKLMPQIYHQAQKVFVYVGEHDDLSLDMLQRLNVLKSQVRSDDDSNWSDMRGKMMWAALKERKYFTRLWILQEIALARQAIVLCGNSSFLWKNITDSYVDMIKKGPSQQHLLFGFDRSISTRPDMELFLLDGGRAACAKDPRDKVFGLLGLLPGRCIGTVIVDYTVSAQHLYTEVAVQLAQIHGWPAVLVRAGLKCQSLTTLPSWVPDWSFTPESSRKYQIAAPMLPHNCSQRVSKNTVRLKLLQHGTEKDQWFVSDFQDGNIDTNILFPLKNQTLLWPLRGKDVGYSENQQLCLILKPHQSPERPLKVLYEARLSNEMFHLPIEQAIFEPRDLVELKGSWPPEISRHIYIYSNDPRQFLSARLAMAALREEYTKHLKNEPAEAWICHAENLWAEKYPPETVTNMGFSVEVFTVNDLLWRWCVRRYAVRSQLVDIV